MESTTLDTSSALVSSGETLKKLRTQIEQNRFSSVSGRWFISQSTVREIFTPDLVSSALSELNCSAHDRLNLEETVCQDGVITFAILTWMEASQYIVKFRHYQCLDSRLPLLSERQALEVSPEIGTQFTQDYQWHFQPYSFRRDMRDHHCVVSKDVILPFVQEKHIAKGGHSRISKVSIPSNLQGFVDRSSATQSKPGVVTVIKKQVERRPSNSHKTYKLDFQKEMEMLRLLRTLNHPNIVPLLASYTYLEEHHFLFPCFEMDLQSFLKLPTRFGDFCRDSTFFLAIYGLASALEKTHSLNLSAAENGVELDAIGYHNDFRPANILVSRNTFILADFGLAELQSAGAGSGRLFEKGEGDYIAPECRTASFRHQRVGRAIDVWAFGCLVTEVLTYMKDGLVGLETFRKSRESEILPGWEAAFFHDTSGELKTNIRAWLDALGSRSPVLESTLLVATRALTSDPSNRPRMSQIRSELAVPTLRVLLYDIMAIFTVYKDAARQRQPMSMQLWYAEERLRIFDEVVSRDHDKEENFLRQTENYDACCDRMMQILYRFESVLESKTADVISSLSVEGIYDRRGSFDDQIQTLVQNLWDTVPRAYERRAQIAFFQSIERAEIGRLSDIGSYWQSHRRAEIIDLGARAQMKAILLEMQNDKSAGAAEFFHESKDLDRIEPLGAHTYGRFKGRKRVLVERMYYRPERESISTADRLLTMQLRAKDFGVDPKPSGLRTLKCLGFVERRERQSSSQEFAFMYELPGTTSNRPLVTLRDLLSDAKAEPSLHSKFQLASALANFFEEFYSVGFLHENFNSRNVVFAPGFSPTKTSIESWSQPYVVGFHKSRPNGQKWGTEGPPDIWEEYEQHPFYRRNKRFVLEYDYYSLGLVLLEIGGWTPLTVWFTRKTYGEMGPEAFRNDLREKYIPRLPPRVGDIYSEVVRTCLSDTLGAGGTDLQTDEGSKEVFYKFFESVARPLESLSALNI